MPNCLVDRNCTIGFGNECCLMGYSAMGFCNEALQSRHFAIDFAIGFAINVAEWYVFAIDFAMHFAIIRAG